MGLWKKLFGKSEPPILPTQQTAPPSAKPVVLASPSTGSTRPTPTKPKPAQTSVDEARALVTTIGDPAQSDFERNNEAAQKLKSAMTDEALASLIELLKSESCQVRSHAAEALGIIGDNRAVDPLIEFLRKPYKDESISYYFFPGGGRGSAITALQKLRDRRTLPALIEALDDLSRDLRRYAAQAIYEIGDEFATEALAKLVILPVPNEAKGTATDKMWALKAIEKFGDERAVRALLQAVKSPSAEICDQAIATLKKFPDVTFDRPNTNCSQDLHWFEHGKCSVCGAIRLHYCGFTDLHWAINGNADLDEILACT